MNVDWSQFRDGDRVRVAFEGVWMRGVAASVVGVALDGSDTAMLTMGGYLGLATSAELIERPFTPPARGKLFRSKVGVLYISLGDRGYRVVRDRVGSPQVIEFPWNGVDPGWRDGIEVLDV